MARPIVARFGMGPTKYLVMHAAQVMGGVCMYICNPARAQVQMYPRFRISGTTARNALKFYLWSENNHMVDSQNSTGRWIFVSSYFEAADSKFDHHFAQLGSIFFILDTLMY